jgi:hypothetical protein
MHKYFNFTKIYEAEQSGLPLDPEEMGTPGSLPEAQPNDKLEDFDMLAKENILEITLTKQDCDDLKGGKSVLKKKPEAQWKDKENETIVKDIALVILNTKNDTAQNEPDALVFNLDDSITNDIIEGIKLGNVTQVLKGLGQDGTDIPEITVRFIKSVDLDISSTETVIPATPEQIESGAVTPNAVTGEMPNESRGIMSFNQFINEGKKQMTKAKVAKEDTKIKKKPKKDKGFPDMSGDGIVTKKDILIAKGVIKK